LKPPLLQAKEARCRTWIPAHRLFERKHAELPNLDVEAGDPVAFRTATGRLGAFGHPVTIETLALNFESVAYTHRVIHFV
jgi:hypothetical protein